MNGSDLFYRETLQPAASEARQERRELAERVTVGMEFRLSRGVFAFGETIDPTRGVGMRAVGPVKPGQYRVWRIDDGSRVVLLALPARTSLRGPELYDERFVSVDVLEMKKFRVEPRS